MDSEFDKLIKAFKEKYFIEEEDEQVSEEQTEVRSKSVFTDDFTDSLPKEEKAQDQLLSDFIRELNNFAEEDEELIDYESELPKMDYQHAIKKVEKRQTERVKSRTSVKDEATTVESKMLQEATAEEEESPEYFGETEISSSNASKLLLSMTEVIDKERLTLQQVKRAYTYQLLDCLVPEYEEELALYDTKGDGTVNVDDLPYLFRSFGTNPSEADLTVLKNTLGEGGKMSFEDFLVNLANFFRIDKYTDDIIESFRMLDVDNRGFLYYSELREVLTSLGECLSAEEMEEMIKEGDPDFTGYIDYEDFVTRMNRNTHIASPKKRRILIKILRSLDRKKAQEVTEEEEETEEREVDTEPEVDPIFG